MICFPFFIQGLKNWGGGGLHSSAKNKTIYPPEENAAFSNQYTIEVYPCKGTLFHANENYVNNSPMQKK